MADFLWTTWLLQALARRLSPAVWLCCFLAVWSTCDAAVCLQLVTGCPASSAAPLQEDDDEDDAVLATAHTAALKQAQQRPRPFGAGGELTAGVTHPLASRLSWSSPCRDRGHSSHGGIALPLLC